MRERLDREQAVAGAYVPMSTTMVASEPDAERGRGGGATLEAALVSRPDTDSAVPAPPAN